MIFNTFQSIAAIISAIFCIFICYNCYSYTKRNNKKVHKVLIVAYIYNFLLAFYSFACLIHNINKYIENWMQ